MMMILHKNKSFPILVFILLVFISFPIYAESTEKTMEIESAELKSADEYSIVVTFKIKNISNEDIKEPSVVASSFDANGDFISSGYGFVQATIKPEQSANMEVYFEADDDCYTVKAESYNYMSGDNYIDNSFDDSPVVSIKGDSISESQDNSPQASSDDSEQRITSLESEVEQLKIYIAELEESNAQLESENDNLKDQLSGSGNQDQEQTDEVITHETESAKERVISDTELAETESTNDSMDSLEDIDIDYSSKSIIQAVQQAFNQAGYNSWRPDGILGPKTRDCILQYQKENGLEENGEINIELIHSLGIENRIITIVNNEAKKDEYRSTYDYLQVARNANDYVGTKMSFSGIVLEDKEFSDSTDRYMRLAVNDDSNNVIFVSYDPEVIVSKLLEDDKAVIYGVCIGERSYTSVMNETITIPEIAADFILIQ